MERIGLLVAVEADAVLRRFGPPRALRREAGFSLYEYRFGGGTLHVLISGAGELAAAAGTQYLISVLGAELIVNAGVAGSLSPALAAGALCLVTSVIHYDFDTSAVSGLEPGQYRTLPDRRIPLPPDPIRRSKEFCPALREVCCASGDKFLSLEADKRAVRERFGGEICEMEAAGVALTCRRSGVPCLILKSVSDGLSGGAEEFQREKQRAADPVMDLAARLTERLISAG